MTSEEYWQEFKARRGLVVVGPARDGNKLCIDPNHTHFEIPDPDEMPEEARNDVLEWVLQHLEQYCFAY